MKKMRICLTCLLVSLVAFGGFALTVNEVTTYADETKEYTVGTTSELASALADTSGAVKTIFLKNDVDYDYDKVCAGHITIKPQSESGKAKINMTISGNSIGPKTSADSLTFERVDFNLVGGDHDYLFKLPVGGTMKVKDSIISVGGESGNIARPIYGASGAPMGKLVLENVDFSKVTAKTAFNYRTDVTLTGTTTKAKGTLIGGGGIITDFTAAIISAEGTSPVTLSVVGDVLRGDTVLNTKLYYTVDGTNPCTNGIEYNAAIDVPSTPNFTIKAVLIEQGEGYFGNITEFKYNEIAQIPDVTANDLIIDYVNKTLSFKSEIEVNGKDDFSGDVILSGANIVPGGVLYARYKAQTEGVAGNVFTLNLPIMPIAPIITLKTATASSIELNDIENGEYKLSASTEYVSSPKFDELNSGTEYSFDIRTKATSNSFESEVATVSFSTLAQFGKVVAGDYNINYVAETFSFDSSVQANKSEDFTGAEFSSGGAITPEETIYIRYAATDSLSAGPISAIKLGMRAETPLAIKLLSKSNSSITLLKISGCEYKITDWQSENTFTALVADTQYTVQMRVKATTVKFASESVLLTVKTSVTADEVSYVSTFEELKAVLENKTANKKLTYLTAAFDLTDTISLYGNNTVLPQEEGILTLNYTKGGSSYVFNVRENSDSLFKNIHINQTADNAYATVYFTDKPAGASYGNGIFRMDNCIIDRTNAYRIFHPAYEGSSIYLNNTTVNGAGISFYRGTYYIYGTTTYDGTVGSTCVLYDYTGVSVSATMSADFKVTLNLTKAPVKNDEIISDAKIYYTLDASNPLTSDTKIEYTAPITVAGIIHLKYTVISEDSSLNGFGESYFFKYVIDYIAETITFDNTIELSERSDFSSTILSGGKIIPGNTIYGREKASPLNLFEFVVRLRLTAPTLTLAKKTDTALEFDSNPLCEYAINDGAFGDSNKFEALTKNTSYTVKCRLKATVTEFASQETVLSFSTMGKKTTVILSDLNLDFGKKVINFSSEIEVNTAENFNGATKVASGSTIIPGATLYARFIGDVDDVAGEALTVVFPALPQEVSGITYQGTLYEISITERTGLEYKIGADGDWQDSNKFVGLAADTEYVFYVRVKASANSFAGVETEIMASTQKLESPDKGCGSVFNATNILTIVLITLATVCLLFIKKTGGIKIEKR